MYFLLLYIPYCSLAYKMNFNEIFMWSKYTGRDRMWMALSNQPSKFSHSQYKFVIVFSTRNQHSSRNRAHNVSETEKVKICETARVYKKESHPSSHLFNFLSHLYLFWELYLSVTWFLFFIFWVKQGWVDKIPYNDGMLSFSFFNGNIFRPLCRFTTYGNTINIIQIRKET